MVNNYEDLIVTDSWRQAAARKAAKLLAGLEKETVQDQASDLVQASHLSIADFKLPTGGTLLVHSEDEVDMEIALPEVTEVKSQAPKKIEKLAVTSMTAEEDDEDELEVDF
ncbi:MAG TPA: hypothetical protein VFD14_03605, partial [Clostridia bacterium]|nr:hypothetical protein [Clostridia bacterium]